MKSFRLSDNVRRFYLLGLVSYGPENCGSGPGVYTKVASFLNWVLDRVSED